MVRPYEGGGGEHGVLPPVGDLKLSQQLPAITTSKMQTAPKMKFNCTCTSSTEA